MNMNLAPDTEPLYEVGEVVILCSRDYPELNGEYVIEHRQAWTDLYPPAPPKCIWAYRLQGCLNGNSQDLWNEAALRKKPNKGPDFDSLMKSLTKPVGETV